MNSFTDQKSRYNVEGVDGFSYRNPNDMNQCQERVDVMACHIRVWAANSPNWFDSSSASIFTEVEDIEIFKSYKELIETATIHIPRGSLLKKNFQVDNYDDQVDVGNITSQPEETELQKISCYGDILADGMNVNKAGESVFSLDSSRPSLGVISRQLEDKKMKDKASKNDLAIGQRIEIWLGYIHEKKEGGPDTIENQIRLLEKATVTDLQTLGLKMCFTGFVTSISPVAPYEIKCENMASLFKKISCPHFISKKNQTVGGVLGEGGLIDIKKKTGIELFSDGGRLSIDIGKVDFETNSSIFDVLSEWGKCGILCSMSEDGKTLKVGRTLYSGSQNGTASGQYMTNNTGAREYIQMDWDVAEDKLQVFRIDKRFLAVDAKAWTNEPKPQQMHVTVIRNPVPGQFNEDATDGEWRYENEKDAREKKKQKKTNGQSGKKQIKSPADLDTYYRVPFFYAGKVPVKGGMEMLKQAARAFYTNFDRNGVNGSLSIFGDRYFVPGQTVGVIDVRVPEKNGYYMIESITTSFGQKGFRREIKLPYKVGKIEAKIKYIRV